MNRWRFCLSTGCRVIAFLDAQEWLIVVVFLYGGNIPFVVSLCFASQRTPTACPNCAGSISTIGLAPFYFKSAGLALVRASAVLLCFWLYYTYECAICLFADCTRIFLKNYAILEKNCENDTEKPPPNAFCAGCPTLQAPCGKPLRQICQTLPGGPEKCLTRAGKSTLPLQLLLAGPIARGIFRAAFRREDAQRS